MPSFLPSTPPPALAGAETVCMRYVPGRGYTVLPTLRWTEIRYERGPQPPRAVFRFAHPADASSLVWFEDHIATVPTIGASPDVVRVDDRIVVAARDAGGNVVLLFDGYAQIPEAAISGQSYSLPFSAQGAAVRCWDVPLNGSFRRDANEPNVATNGRRVDLPARLNPDGKANATGNPTGDYSWDYDWNSTSTPAFKSPLFTDEVFPKNLALWTQPYRRHWTLGMAARYILGAGFAFQHVTLPLYKDIERTLKAVVPVSSTVNASDPATFSLKDITCPDMTISGMPWPEALWRLIHPHGFSFAFRLSQNADITPKNVITFERDRDMLDAKVKEVYLQARGSTLVSGQSNVKAISLARDASQVINCYEVQMHPDEYEISVVLTPGYDLDDIDTGAPEQYLATNPDLAFDRDLGRLFVADEGGEGHWDYELGAWSVGRFTGFTNLWGPNWVVRRRPGYDPLFSTDNKGNRRQANLCILTQYAGPAPALWDGTGVATPVKSSWRMLRDRLGVRLNASDLTNVSIGKLDEDNPISDYLDDRVDVLNGVIQSEAGEAGRKQLIYFLLTCVVSADRAPSIIAGRRSASSTRFVVFREVDGRDRYKRQFIHKSSWWAQNSGLFGDEDDYPGARYTSRDDSSLATQYAEALRSSTEFASMGGSLTVGRLTTAYFVGDRISGMFPRMAFTTNTGDGSGESQRYPTIVAITFRNGDRQETVLQLDDRRAEGEPLEVLT